LEETDSCHASDCLKAEKTALRLIARAEQCSAGLARKLEKRKFDTACVNTVIARLLELNLLNDDRFARLWLESHLRRAHSPRRLLSALCTRGIDRDDAETALKAVLDEEAETSLLTRFVKKHSKKAKGEREGNLKFLLKSEGFSNVAIQKFLDEVL